MLSNYHTHTHYCDGKSDIQSIVIKAVELKLTTLGISSHAPLPFPCDWCMNLNQLDSYLDEIEVMKGRFHSMEIYKGLEVDFIPQITGPAQFKHKLDYTIGSIHFVEQFQSGKHWEIDGSHSVFLEGLKIIFSGNIKEAVTRYYEITREMVKSDTPDILGHLDKIKIQNFGNSIFDEHDSWYQHELRKTLDLIAQHNTIIEVNTRGIYQGKTKEPYPGYWALEYIYKKKIPIVLNSDAHYPDQLIRGFTETLQLLQKIGFTEIMTLTDGTWKSLPINSLTDRLLDP